MLSQKRLLRLRGKSLSPGLAEGVTFVYHDVLDRLDEYYDIEPSRVAEERLRLQNAIDRICRELGRLTTRIEKEMDAQLASVFEAHRMMLLDPSLTGDVEREIEEELVSAGRAVRTVFRRWERRFLSMEAEIARQKSDDIKDLARRLINALAGNHGHALADLPEGSVLVTKRLLPSDTVFLSRRSAAAVVLEQGGTASHAALFVREIGLPCIGKLPNLLEQVPKGARVIVDADEAVLTVHPDSNCISAFHSKGERRAQAVSIAKRHADKPAVTLDGVSVSVMANVGGLEDTQEAIIMGAEGIGLYRTEQAYIGRQVPPDTEQLLDEMRRTVAPVGVAPCTIRLIDIGADKPLPFLQSTRETNPALGRRGVRLLLEFPDLLNTQLDVLVTLSQDYDVRILVPMVVLPSDMRDIRDALAKCCKRHGVALPRLGAMIETPAAALHAAAIAKYADFFSVGTNDLTQYTFAADRESASVDSYFNDAHDVIFRLLQIIHTDAPDLALSVCGELAGRPEYTERLLQCGVDTLSVAPPLVPGIKESIRKSGVNP